MKVIRAGRLLFGSMVRADIRTVYILEFCRACAEMVAQGDFKLQCNPALLTETID